MKELALDVRDLHASIGDKPILKGVNLAVPTGEIHVIMGPNGSGKSTLANTLMGHPSYEVTSGKALLFGEDLLAMKVYERARKGLFLAYQYPVEVPGVAFSRFLWSAHEAVTGGKNDGSKKNPKKVLEFRKKMNTSLESLKMSPEFGKRHLNVGASGGEKKRLEVCQMQMLSPRVVIMDEIDSGLDIDSIKVVAKSIGAMRSSDFTALIITHYPRILEHLEADKIHVIAGGRILCSRGPELAKQLEKKGYDWILKEYDAAGQ